jgi:hypothetical protein
MPQNGAHWTTGHYGCLLGQSGHFGGSHAMITQNVEKILKSVFCHTLRANMGIKELVGPGPWLS